MIGTTELLIIVGVIVLLFGSSAIPRFARALGKAKKEFEIGLKEGEEEYQKKIKKSKKTNKK
jgi:sec-independent protein translocase protein TatA